jgi:hypothetical protein
MYKRGTFGASCPPLRSRFGVIEIEGLKGYSRKCENEIVMKEIKKVRTGWLTIRLNEDEEKKLDQLYKRTTSNSLSEYARDVLLKEPVNVIYRNQTADEFLAEMILLKNELNAIGKNFNQVVHKLHTLDHVSEIKAWTMLNETSKKSFMKKVDEIKEKMNQIYEQWSQK